MKIQTILATKGARVITIRPDETVHAAMHLLSTHNVGALAVLDPTEQLVGILCERDIIRDVAHHHDVLNRRVMDLMTSAIITGAPQDDVQAVLETMSTRRIRHMPILDDGSLAGMIAVRDLERVLMDDYVGEIETLELRLIAGGTEL